MFRLLGLKMLSPDDNNTTPEDKHDVQCMQKSLFGRKDWIYFYKEVRIADNEIELPNDFECDKMLYSTNRVSLSFCAIVGKNGKGKSTAIDMVIRILNNLSAVIIGEKETFNAAERLHFISNVYGELAVLIDKRIIIINCRGGLVELKYYEGTSKAFKHTETKKILDWNGEEVIKNNPDEYETLKDLFYTIVFNYSMYAYNYRDYFREADRQITDINGDIKEEDIWLKGVFHKNDGYQTPIVIHPMRSGGMIDVPKENKLAKERLLSMLFYKDEEEKFPFRYINDELEIMAVCLPSLEYKKFGKTKIRTTLGIKKGRLDEDFKKYYEMILKSWMEWIDLPMPKEDVKEPEYDYIVYKTLKIIRTYKQYNKVSRNLFSANYNEKLFQAHMKMMRKDTSHVTLKLRRCLFNLKFRLYVGKSRSLYNLNDAFEKANQICNDINNKKWGVRLIDLLPPPTTEIHFQIVKKDKIKSNRAYEDKDIIPFEGLSSGERQIAYTVSNLMYHLINIDSVSSKYLSDKKESQDKSLLKYRYVNIMLDEVELYFHPDLQRRFLYYVKTAIDNILFESIKGINVMVVTHSPFVISDLPRKNILFLGKEKEPGETYCANIHDMLNQSFFMDYSIGEIARKELQHIIKLYEQRNDIDRIKNDLKENKEKYDYLSKTIADEYLKKTIGRILEELYRQVQTPRELLDNKIQTMEKELKRLRKKRKNYDKDGIQST